MAREKRPQRNETYRLTADIWMPYFRFKLHPGRLEGILVVEQDANHVFATGVRRVSRPQKPALEGRQRRLVHGRSVDAGVVLVLSQVLQLLHDPTISAVRHGDWT